MIVDDFRNRVAKNARNLGKWAKRERVTCYRVYDQDIPEVPITVDTYAGAIVVNDFRYDFADKQERNGGDAWLDDMASAAASALDAKDVFVKRRERITDRAQQYSRTGEDNAFRDVEEGGHKFIVNLSDYLDTGLFLDHRLTRARAAKEDAATMLNLFSYTCAFSVYCGAAGMQTTSVDMSTTYLDWGAANLNANRLDGEIVQSDVREFLRDARRKGRRWDLVVVDPPTFSNSKRMDYTWDVQRDHVALLDDVAAVASKVIWFSTNSRRFKMQWLGGSFTDETAATLPPDFRDKKIHQAFRIEV